MAAIYKRGTTLWMVYYVNGQRFRESLDLPATNKGWAEARKIKRIKEGELAQGIHLEKLKVKNQITIQTGFNEFIATRRGKSERTIESYQEAFNKLLNYAGNIRLNQVDEYFVGQFENHLKTTPNKRKKILSERSIATYLRNLRIIFKYFVEKEYIRVNYFPKIKIKDSEIVTIPLDELQKMLELLKDTNYEHYKIIMMFLMTGLRASELTRLTYGDIDFKKNMLNITNTKGHRTDQFPLYPKLRSFIIENFEDGEGKLFNLKDRHSLKFWKRFLAGANKDKKVFPHYSIHTLRKTFITMLANGGMNIFDVSKLARHRDIRTTLKSYAAAELDRMGEAVNAIENIATIYATRGSKH